MNIADTAITRVQKKHIEVDGLPLISTVEIRRVRLATIFQYFRRAGFTVREISRYTGIHHNSISRFINEKVECPVHPEELTRVQVEITEHFNDMKGNVVQCGVYNLRSCGDHYVLLKDGILHEIYPLCVGTVGILWGNLTIRRIGAQTKSNDDITIGDYVASEDNK